MEPLLWDTSVQWTPPFRPGHKIWSRENVHMTLLKGRVYSGERDTYFFWVQKPGFNLHSGDTLALI